MEPYQRVMINGDILDISKSKKNIIRGNAMPGGVEGHVQFAWQRPLIIIRYSADYLYSGSWAAPVSATLPCICKFRSRCQPSSTSFLRPSWSWNTLADNNERHNSTFDGSYCSWSVVFYVDFLCHLKIATGGPTDWVSPEYVMWSASNSAGPSSATYDSQNAIIQAAQSYADRGPWSTSSSYSSSAF